MRNSFERIVNDSYTHLYSRDYPNLPTDAEVAEDIVDNYEEFYMVDLSSPEKLNEWVREVRQELIRQQLAFIEER